MDFLAELKSLLQYHEGIGLRQYPRNDAVKRFLSQNPLAAPGKKRAESAESPRTTVQANREAKGLSVEVPRAKLGEIEDEIVACTACELHKHRIYPVAGRGGGNVRLMIVGDWLGTDKAGSLPEGHLFGVDQDMMLERMLSAINLPVSDVFITNVIKCAVPANRQPQAVHVQSCISYLRRQIASLQPEIICTMGIVVSRALLAKSQPLSKLRGQFHYYQLDEKTKIPVLATYHPTYLLQNPEMKKATWEDLKLLGRRLGLQFK